MMRNLPIRRQLTLIIVVTSAIALLLASAGFLAYEQYAYKRDLLADLATTAQTLGVNSASALSFEDADSARQTLQSLAAQPNVVAACLYDRAGAVFATYPEKQRPDSFPALSGSVAEKITSDRAEVFRPIALAGETIGTIYVRSGLGEMEERLRRYALIVAGVMLVALLIAYAIATWLQRVISAPISDLAAIAGRVAAQRDYSVRAAARGSNELGRLIDGFNDMLDQIQARDAALRSANENLERRVVERTEALAHSLSLIGATLESTADGIVAVELSGRVTNHNSRFADMWRIPPDMLKRGDTPELADHIAAQVVNPEQFLQRVSELMTTPPKGEVADQLELRDGRIFERYIHPQVVGGQITGLVVNFRDVTERNRASARLAEASALLEAMLENSPDFIYFKDRASRFTRFGRAVLTKFKLTDPAELRGKTDMDFFTEEHSVDAYNDEQEIIRTGRPIVGKLERETHPDGRVTWVLTTKMPWRDGSGEIVGTFGITKDVTELKDAEAKLAYERDQLRALLDSSPDTIYFKDTESRFVRVSRSKALKTIERVSDLPERRRARGLNPDVPAGEVLTGLTDFDTYQDEDARIAYEDEQKVVRTGQAMIGKLEKQVYRDGTVRWNLTSKMPWRDTEGRIIGTFGISKDITDLKDAEEKLEAMHKQLMDTSRQAGMAEVATGVLHNVGNVLNSVNVSATLVSDHIRHSKAGNVAKLAALFAQNKANLGEFMVNDPRGKMVPDYLGTLAEQLVEEHKTVMLELEHLRKNVEHIKDIVAMQQSYARTSGVLETISVPDMIEDALRMNAGSLARHDVQTVRDYRVRPVITTDKHKVMQILINLVRNAKYACDEAGRADKKIIVRITSDERWVKISVIDNGVGIVADNLTRIFSHGFTTRKHGHGFGLHSGALAAKELGGELGVESEGVGKGATFVLKLPFAPEMPASSPSP